MWLKSQCPTKTKAQCLCSTTGEFLITYLVIVVMSQCEHIMRFYNNVLYLFLILCVILYAGCLWYLMILAKFFLNAPTIWMQMLYLSGKHIDYSEKMSKINSGINKKVFTFFFSQNLFFDDKNFRTMSLNTHYIFLTKNPR